MTKMGDNIKKYRLAAGLTQQQVADLLGIDKSSVSKIERGETTRVKDEQVDVLCKALNCTPSDIYGIQTFKFSSSVPLSDEQNELITLIPLLTEDEAKALLEVVKAMFGYKNHAGL